MLKAKPDIRYRRDGGFTLIEIIVVIVIMGILATVAMRSLGTVYQSAKIEETKQELEQIGKAMAGNPELANNGTRTDYGYIGDVGSFPANLDALNQNPGGYSTWDGPYIQSDFTQMTNDYKQDAWGAAYTYGGGVDITSTGSGANIVHKVGNASTDFLINRVTGNVYDINGIPPGTTLADSVSIELTIPDGSGSTLLKTTIPSAGGYFAFDSIPIGNHDIRIVYKPSNDTLGRFVSVLPQSSLYTTYLLDSAYFASGGSGPSGDIVYVDGTATTTGGDCEKFFFDITNTSGSVITLTSLVANWSAPTAYYKEIKIDGDRVYEEDDPRIGSGETASFESSFDLAAGQTVTIEIIDFKDDPNGGDKVNMSNTDFAVTFSDGSVVTFNTGTCN